MLPGEPAFVSASFLVFDRKVQASDIPSTVTLQGCPLTSISNVKFAGIGTGNSDEQPKRLFEEQGRKFLPGDNGMRIGCSRG
jgi:hypothetical protein